MPKHVEIINDGRTVWVNTEICIGRFSAGGVDVHKDFEGQLNSGDPCLDCIHGLPPRESWDRFVASMLTHHGVIVPETYRPGFVPAVQ